jgi:hypothetical protein
MKIHSQIDLAYAAGIIDGEGCITICREINRLHHYCYRPVVTVAMSQPEAVELLHSMFGGWKFIDDKRNRTTDNLNRKPLLVWRVCGDDTHDVLACLVPYLRVKKDQGLTVMAYVLERRMANATKAKRKKGTNSYDGLEEFLYWRMRHLNHPDSSLLAQVG